MDLEDYLQAAGNVGMGALETVNAPFQIAGEAIRGASEGEPLKMATASDPSGFRYPSIVQRLAPSTRTEQPPADPFIKSYQGLEGLMNLPRGVQAASDVVTGEPDIASQIGGFGLALGVMPPGVKAASEAELPKGLTNERGGVSLGPGAEPPTQLPAPSPWFSRLENTLEAKLPEKADVGQIKNIVSTLPKEEVDWRGLNDFLEQKHGLVPKAEVMEQLKKNPVEIGETKLAGTREDYRRPSTGDEDLPREVLDKADELQQEDADRALEDFNYDPGEGYGVEPIDRSQEEIGRGAGEKDLFGEEIKPLPEKYIVKYDNEPLMHEDLNSYNAKKSVPNEEGHAVFSDENDARNAYYEHIEEDEMNARDEAYRDFLREHPVENYYEDAKDEVGYVPEDEEAEQLPGGPGAGPTKYERYTTPGGQNYREVLMTLPSESARIAAENARQNVSGIIANIEPSKVADFQSSHWEQPNVLAHIRLKDFADPATGQKTLLVDEIQSDWHQKGRSEGYKTPESLGAKNKMRENDHIIAKAEEEAANIRFKYKDEAKTMDKDAFNAMLYQKEPRYSELMTDWTKAKNENVALAKTAGGNIPNAPFKKNWHELAFKRALQEAVAGGYDEMAWTTGEQQADRYSLAKQVNTIDVQHIESADPAMKGAKAVEIQLHGGGNIHLGVNPEGVVINTNRNQNELAGKSLDEIVGKEIAQKIMSGTGEISGEGLKIGGQGMKGFYDKILPDYANKYLKKYGVKVEDGPMVAPEEFKGRLRYQIEDRNGEPYDAFETREAAERAKRDLMQGIGTDRFMADWRIKDLATEKPKPEHMVHKIKITPEMKADILGKGQPMWQVPAMVGVGAAGAVAGAKSNQNQYAGGGIVEEEAMPFQSQAQRAFMYAKHPKIAEKFQAETPKNAKLPEHVKKMNRGGVVGDWKDDLSTYMNEHFSQKRPQYMADGGVAGGYDVFTGDTDTVHGIPSMPPPPNPMASVVPNPAPRPAFNPMAGLPPPASPLMPKPPMASPRAAGPMGPDPALQSYLSQQNQSLNKYGPEEQIALEQALQKQRSGFVPRLANAGAGLADAIMQGVARAGPSNFQSNLQSRWDKSEEGQRQAFEKAQTGNLARMKQQMELAQIDPSSPISRMAQRSASPILKRIGLSDSEIQNMPASLVGEAETKGLSLEEIRQKAEETKALREQTHEYQMGELGLRGETLRANMANQAAERQTKQAELREKAATGLQQRPYYQKAIETIPLFRSAATREQMSQIQANPNNREALDWIQQHPNDPRIPDIIKKLAR